MGDDDNHNSVKKQDGYCYDSIIEGCVAKEFGTQGDQNININAIKSGIHVHRRILLDGPQKSGKSSLVMDLALSVASREPCRCPCFGTNIFQSSTSSTAYCEQTCQNCVAVTVFVLASNDDRDFPLLCEKQQQSTSKLSSRHSNEKILLNTCKRIHVRHVNTVRDVVSYLLTISGLPIDQQPFGGIFIDDIDVLCSRNDSASSLIRMSQVGKL
jgi:hypothetical protein